MTEIQEPPFSVQIEPVEGCPLRCDFCGIHGIRTDERVYKHMTIEIAERIAMEMARCQWTSRVEFAMHGEPTLHPGLLDIIAVFRKFLPKNYFLLTTNGCGFTEDPVGYAQGLHAAGINCVGIDCYDGVGWSSTIRGALTRGGVKFYDYPADGDIANPHIRKKGHSVVFLAPIDQTSNGTHGKKLLGNHCGCAAPLDTSAKDKRCARPFRELSFRWDGNVAICCNDWRGVYSIGNILDMPLDDLWQHPKFRAARRKLYNNQRDFGPCLGCNHRSFRVGFLPDKQGKQTLPLPNSHDLTIIRQNLKEQPLTEPVRRPWECK